MFDNENKQSTSSYSYSKKNIIQDEVLKKENQDVKKNCSLLDNLHSKLVYLKELTNNYFLSFKNKFNISKNVNWAQAGHKTASFLMNFWKIVSPIVKIFPVVLILFSIIQIGLFISKNLLPLNPHYEWGWNNDFISALPEIFHPTKQWFHQFLLVAFCLIFGRSALKLNFSTKIPIILMYNFIACTTIVFTMFEPQFIYDTSIYVFTSLIFLRHFLSGKESENMFEPLTYSYYHWNPEDDEYRSSNFIIETQDLCTDIINTSCKACFFAFLFLCCFLIGYVIYTPIENINFYLVISLVMSMFSLFYVKKRFYIEPIDVCPKCLENRATKPKELISKIFFEYDGAFSYYKCISTSTCRFCGYSYKQEYETKDVE